MPDILNVWKIMDLFVDHVQSQAIHFNKQLMLWVPPKQWTSEHTPELVSEVSEKKKKNIRENIILNIL